MESTGSALVPWELLKGSALMGKENIPPWELGFGASPSLNPKSQPLAQPSN